MDFYIANTTAAGFEPDGAACACESEIRSLDLLKKAAQPLKCLAFYIMAPQNAFLHIR
jgi:hypothetical protein